MHNKEQTSHVDVKFYKSIFTKEYITKMQREYTCVILAIFIHFLEEIQK
jgi:hypothetical protein